MCHQIIRKYNLKLLSLLISIILINNIMNLAQPYLKNKLLLLISTIILLKHIKNLAQTYLKNKG